MRPDDSIMAKEADKEVKAAQDYIRKLNIVSTKGPQANAPTDFIEEKADPQVSLITLQLSTSQFTIVCRYFYHIHRYH